MKDLFDVDKMVFRCSSIHKLMGNAKSIDDSLMSDEAKAIKKLPATKRSPEQKKVLDDLLFKTLSATAKTLVKEMLREKIHNAPYKFTGSKETEKGNAVEDDAILYLMKHEFISAEKNTVRFTNDFITGEPDVICNGVVYDTKCPWSYWSHPIFADDIESKSLDSGYDWQQIGYMWLLNEQGYNIKEAKLKYILMPTPVPLLTRFDDHGLHIDYVLSLSPSQRIRTYNIEYDLEKIKLIKIKIEMARAYAKSLLQEL